MRVWFANTLAAVTLLIVGAVALASETDKTVLTVSGQIGQQTQADFSLKMLEQFPVVEIVTGTPWHDSQVTFVGVSLSDLMQTLEASGDSVEVIALNDYRATIPFSDFEAYGPILAYKLNGSFMSVREKGPLFIIYPFDDNPQLRSEAFYARSVWQVRSIVVD